MQRYILQQTLSEVHECMQLASWILLFYELSTRSFTEIQKGDKPGSTFA